MDARERNIPAAVPSGPGDNLRVWIRFVFLVHDQIAEKLCRLPSGWKKTGNALNGLPCGEWLCQRRNLGRLQVCMAALPLNPKTIRKRPGQCSQRLGSATGTQGDVDGMVDINWILVIEVRRLVFCCIPLSAGIIGTKTTAIPKQA